MAARLPDEAAPSPADAPLDPSITFGSFRLDLRGGRLLRGQQAIPLRPKTWAVLRYLAERPGALVTKDELLDAVWAEVNVTPDTLAKSIGELRVVFADDVRTPRFIETVHRRGFRFIAMESELGEPARAVTSAPMATPPVEVFVGREVELRHLATSLAKAQAGARQMVFVTGPAGIGKTALVDAFLASPAIRQSDGVVWVGRGGCIEHHGPRETYLPILEALQRLARRPDDERLLDLMRRIAPMWLVQMPWLMEPAKLVELRRSLEGVGAERMLRELALLVEALTTEGTLVLVIEDLHWTDPSTVDLLAELGRRRDPARLLLIATYRPAEVAVGERVLAAAVRTLQERRLCTELSLADLGEAARHYLAARFPRADFPESLARVLHQHTRGDPMFVVAVVDHMLSRGMILDTDPGWSLAAPPERLDLGMPDDLRRMIETQFRRLAPSERSLLEAASVAGASMTAELGAAVVGGTVADAERTCETLSRGMRFLRPGGSVERPDGREVRSYGFVHELYRHVVYEEIPTNRRAQLHQRIGEALEKEYGDGAAAISASLAVHFERGGSAERALHYLLAAGARARQRFANSEALGHLQSALAMVAKLAEGSERRRRELEVRLALGPVLSDTLGFGAAAVSENYDRATELGVEVATPAQQFELLYARWYLHAIRGERETTITLTEELNALARRLATPASQALADAAMVRTAVFYGRFADAVAHSKSAAAPRRRKAGAVQAVAYGAEPSIVTTSVSAMAHWYLGQPERAREMAGTALAQARRGGHLFTLAAVLTQGAFVELLCRNTDAGDALAAEAMSLSGEYGFAFWSVIGSLLCGWSLVQRGNASAGIRAIERALAAMEAAEVRFYVSYGYAFLAEGHLSKGSLAAGLTAVDAGLLAAQTTLSRAHEPELWRLKGALLLAQAGGRRSKAARAQEAEACLLRAIELSRASQAKSLKLRAATTLARRWKEQGRAAEAVVLLEGVCGAFDSSSRTPDLVEARQVLDELAGA